MSIGLTLPSQLLAQDSLSNGWSLSQCITYAIDNNLTIKNAVLDQNSAEVNYMQAKSQWYPNLSFNASQRLSNGSSIDPITSDFVSQTIHSTSFGLNTSIPLFQGFQISNQIKQNQLLVNQNELAVEETKNAVKLNLINAYLQVLYAAENVKVAQTNVSNAEEEFVNVQGNYKAGNATLKDVSEIQSQKASYDYSLVQAQVNYDQQLLTLKQLLELTPEDQFEVKIVDDSFVETWVIPSVNEIYLKSLDIMPEVKSSDLQVQINETNMDIAKGGYLPSVNLSGGVSTGYTNTQSYTFDEQLNSNFSTSLGVSLSVPIMSRNQNKANVQNASIDIQQSQNQVLTIKKQLYQSIETAWQNAVSAQKQIESADAARNSAKQSYDFAKKQHEVGALSTFDLIISQNTYTAAEQTYIQAKYMGIMYKLLIDFYQGENITLN